MPLGLAFWVLMLVWLVFGLMTWWPANNRVFAYAPLGHGLLLFVLFVLLGWRVFGAPLH